ncbi:MAG TPA: hypothetical protein VFR32_02070, partial [Gaiellaceae bacterium]|nr:hypothetical protein [Gaiellaceae bacterium]
TYTASSFKFDTKGQTIPEGTYCTSGKFEINNDDISGKITVVAYEIVVNGANTRLEPYENGVLFFNTGNKELVLNGLSFTWSGTMFSPYGRIKINAYNNASLTGMIAGREVEINGDSFNVYGTGPTGAKRKIKLVE